MEQDSGGSEFVSFYGLTISSTGNFFGTKIFNFKKFNPNLDNCLNYSHNFEEIMCDKK